VTPKPPNSCGRSAPHAPHPPSVCSTSHQWPHRLTRGHMPTWLPLPRPTLPESPDKSVRGHIWNIHEAGGAGRPLRGAVDSKSGRNCGVRGSIDTGAWLTRHRINKVLCLRALLLCDVLQNVWIGPCIWHARNRIYWQLRHCKTKGPPPFRYTRSFHIVSPILTLLTTCELHAKKKKIWHWIWISNRLFVWWCSLCSTAS
jgi:hypothetical protein